MNVERFHAMVDAILRDLSLHNYPAKLTELVNALRNRLSDPGNAGHQQSIDRSIIELRNMLPALASNDFPAAWRPSIHEYGLDLFVGHSLLAKIEDVLLKNQVTPTVAEEMLRKTLEQINSDVEAIRKLKEAFDKFHVPIDEPKPGIPEVGVVVPRAAVNDGLSQFGREITKLAKIVAVFQEINTGSREDPKISSVSSSDFSIFFMIDLETAKQISDAIRMLVNGFETVVKLKKTIESLREEGVPDSGTSGLEKHADTLIEAKIEEIVSETIKTEDGKTIERKSELRIELKGALGAMAERMDNGFVFEVRAREPAKARDDATAEQLAAEQAAVKKINENNRQTAFITDGRRPILSIGVDPQLALKNAAEPTKPRPKRGT